MPISGYTVMESHKECKANYSQSIISAAVFESWIITNIYTINFQATLAYGHWLSSNPGRYYLVPQYRLYAVVYINCKMHHFLHAQDLLGLLHVHYLITKLWK